MTEKLITIVCCMGNKQIFDLRLGVSLKGKEEEYNLIILPLDLTVPQAYNSINCNEINTKYIMFVHEDVLFLDNDWIKKIYNSCESVKNLGVAGVAGVIVGGGPRGSVGYVLHWGSRGVPRQRGFGCPTWDGKIVQVQTLDAQCLIVPTEIFKKYKFNEEFPFHMMAEDYCLTLKYDYNLGVVVIPIKVWHNEAGLGRGKIHGDLAKWHQKLKDKWWNRLSNIGIYCTSKGYGIEVKATYCPRCGGDIDTLTTHIPDPEFNYECRICHYRWGKRRKKT